MDEAYCIVRNMNRGAKQGEIVYGPVESRRLGWSLGIDLTPVGIKACPLDCLYCQCGRTDVRICDASQAPDVEWPSAERVTAVVKVRLVEQASAGRPIEDISICGTGEPTLHPNFNEVARDLASLRDRFAPQAKLTVFTSALSNMGISGAARPGLLTCDRRFVKLDAGSDRTLRRLAHPAEGARIEDAITAIAKLPDVDVQTMICSGPSGNDSDEALAEWVEALVRAKPARAHVVTIERDVAEPLAVLPASPELLERAAAMARERGIDCTAVK